MDKIVPITLKVGAKVALNTAQPGYGSIVDFGEAIRDCYNEDYISALINVGFGIADLFSFGVFGAVKDTVNEVGIKAAVAESAKTGIGKNVGKQLGKEIIDEIVEEKLMKSTRKAAIEGAGKDVLRSGGMEAMYELLGLGLRATKPNEAYKSIISAGAYEFKKELHKNEIKWVARYMKSASIAQC